MKADALKAIAAKAGSGEEPTDAEAGAAIGEAVDLALGFFADVRRIADAAEKLAATTVDRDPTAV